MQVAAIPCRTPAVAALEMYVPMGVRRGMTCSLPSDASLTLALRLRYQSTVETGKPISPELC